MAIKKMEISGFRGYSKKETLNFSIPNGMPGSGLNVIVGANNSGKSTIIEAMNILEGNTDLVSEDKRNKKSGDKINIIVEDTNDVVYKVSTTEIGGGFISRKSFKNGNEVPDRVHALILNNKRNFSTFFSNMQSDRINYISNKANSEYRNENGTPNDFGSRLLNIYRNDKFEIFQKELEKIITPLPDWTIDAGSQNMLYLKFKFGDIYHSSIGAGDGFVNIFTIVDSLYDAKDGETILIDEPEISLHPDIQKKLMEFLVEHSANKQIIICTHSPYFIDWSAMENGMSLFRTKKHDDNDIEIYKLQESKENIKSITNDQRNPHILGLDAKEIFFLTDNIILTEGQEDVIYYNKIFKLKNFDCNVSFFGWGAGSADKMDHFLRIFEEFGYEKVFVILDHDKMKLKQALELKYKKYCFFCTDADDVRNKEVSSDINKTKELIESIKSDTNLEFCNQILDLINDRFKLKEGIIKNTSTMELNMKYDENIIKLIDEVKKYFCIKPIIKTAIIKNQEEIPTFLINDIIDDYIKKNPDRIVNYIQKKYERYNFDLGSGYPVKGFKRIDNNRIFVTHKIMAGINTEEIIEYQVDIFINIDERKVYDIKYTEIKNTIKQ